MKEAKFCRGEKCQLNKIGKESIKNSEFEKDSEVIILSIFTNPNDTTNYMIEDSNNHTEFIRENDLIKLKKPENECDKSIKRRV